MCWPGRALTPQFVCGQLADGADVGDPPAGAAAQFAAAAGVGGEYAAYAVPGGGTDEGAEV
jgi:hypothetical protein